MLWTPSETPLLSLKSGAASLGRSKLLTVPLHGVLAALETSLRDAWLLDALLSGCLIAFDASLRSAWLPSILLRLQVLHDGFLGLELAEGCIPHPL